MKDINISQEGSLFIVTVGCQKFTYISALGMLEELKTYVCATPRVQQCIEQDVMNARSLSGVASLGEMARLSTAVGANQVDQRAPQQEEILTSREAKTRR